MKRTALLLSFILCITTICATPSDSVLSSTSDSISFATNDSLRNQEVSPFGKKIDNLTSSSLYQMTYVGVPLIIAGAIVKKEDTHFRHLRNDYLPQFRRHFDDYLQYTPAIAMLGMKAFGVESRSSWGRMLASDAFSVLLMGGVINTLKHTTHVMRPDGSNNHSFPSGHTATAFMTASMLTKEYGHKSPWIGIGAYSVASATGLMRMANNKHWLSDVLTGAGIGILSTEVGYYLADLIFKEKGIRKFEDGYQFDRLAAPSFVSLYLGVNIPLSHFDLAEGMEFRTSSGSSAGIEGAYFINPYLGFGGRFAVSNTAIIVNDKQAENNTFDAVSFAIGGYFSYPLSTRWSIGSKLLAGYVHYPKLTLTNTTLTANGALSFGSGISLSFKAKPHYGMRFFLDYDLNPSHSKSSHEWMNMLVLGGSFMVTLR